jgi:hypothetical protein
LVLFNEIGQLAEEIPLVPDQHRTGDVWHVRLTGVRHERGYALRADGPWCPEQGHRFNGNVLLLDPYATAVSRRAASSAKENPGIIACYSGAGSECCVADDYGAFDWQNDRPPRNAWRDTIIYETHVRGLTIDPSSAVGCPGCYLGLVEKIPYLRDLGITAIELMPVQEFHDAAAGVLTLTLAVTSIRDHRAAAAIGAAIAGMLSIGLMAAVNFTIHSDFKWLLLSMALVWAASIARFVRETMFSPKSAVKVDERP